MKVGDKKQAIVLGVVAVGALGFLGNSIFGAFGGSSQSASAATTPSKPASEEKKVVASYDPDTNPSTKNSLATENEEAKNLKAREIPSEGEIFLYRDSFVAPNAKPLKPDEVLKKREPKKSVARPAIQPINPFSSDGDAPPAMKGKLPNANEPDENTGKDRRLKPEDAKSREELEVRYEGFVEAHSRMAIISINGEQITADEGEVLANGIRLLKIQEDRLLIVVKSMQRTIWLGKGVKF